MGMLEGKVAVITGSGRGIGAAAAKLFAAEGAAVVVSDLDPTAAEETAGAIRQAGGKAIVLAGFSTLKRVVKGHCSCRPWRERIHTKPEKVKCKCTRVSFCDINHFFYVIR